MIETIGIIDLGSNSFRLIVTEVDSDGYYRIKHQYKEYVRIGQNMEKTHIINENKKNQAIQSLIRMKSICTSMHVTEIVAVATAAIRSARNRNEFIQEAKEKTKIDIKVLSGTQEAYYDYLAIVCRMNIKDALIMDIGGGSTELILMKNKKLIHSISLNFGALQLSEKFGIIDKVLNSEKKALHNYVINEYNKIPWLPKNESIPLIGVGGTIRNIAKIDRKQKKYPLDITHGYNIKNKDINKIYELVSSKKLKERKNIKGLSEDRVDIIVGATAAICKLIEHCNIKNVIVSGGGIREGLIHNFILKNNQPASDILEFWLVNILHRFHMNKKHSIYVYHFMEQLFTQLKGIHHINDSHLPVIKTAAILHDIGSNIRYYHHHKHSFYMILNLPIYGISQKHLLMSAYVALMHRNKSLKMHWSKYKSILDEHDVKIVKELGVLLSIAENLDVCMNSNITSLNCDIYTNEVVITIDSINDSNVEIAHAITNADRFYKLFNKRLIIKN